MNLITIWIISFFVVSDSGRDWGQEEKGTTEDEMAGWHHWLDERDSEWTAGDDDEQGGLACWDLWGLKESDTTERLNWTELMQLCKEKNVIFSESRKWLKIFFPEELFAEVKQTLRSNIF